MTRPRLSLAILLTACGAPPPASTGAPTSSTPTGTTWTVPKATLPSTIPNGVCVGVGKLDDESDGTVDLVTHRVIDANELTLLEQTFLPTHPGVRSYERTERTEDGRPVWQESNGQGPDPTFRIEWTYDASDREIEMRALDMASGDTLQLQTTTWQDEGPATQHTTDANGELDVVWTYGADGREATTETSRDGTLIYDTTSTWLNPAPDLDRDIALDVYQDEVIDQLTELRYGPHGLVRKTVYVQDWLDGQTTWVYDGEGREIEIISSSVYSYEHRVITYGPLGHLASVEITREGDTGLPWTERTTWTWDCP